MSQLRQRHGHQMPAAAFVASDTTESDHGDNSAMAFPSFTAEDGEDESETEQAAERMTLER